MVHRHDGDRRPARSRAAAPAPPRSIRGRAYASRPMSPADRRSAISQRRHTGLRHPAPTLRLQSIEQSRNGVDMHTDVSPPPPRATALSSEQLAARELGRTRRAALRRRARRIRRGVAGLAAVTFSAAFLAIYVELASGHDPALSTKQATASPSAQNASTKSNGSS